VFDLTGSTVATGATFIAETVPALVVGPLAGLVVDRLDRRRLMIVTDLGRALAVLSMLLATSPNRLWILYLALVLENAAAQVYRPARQALVPWLIGSDQRLASANASFAVIDGLVRLIGSVLGGLLYLALGFTGLVLIDVASYLVSAAACTLVRYRQGHRDPGRRAPPVPPAGSPAASGLSRGRAAFGCGLVEVRAGFRYVWDMPPLRGLLLVTAAFYLANGALTALLVPFARIQLHVDADTFGFLLAALGVGYLVGTPLARLIIDRYSTRIAVLVSIPLLTACFVLAFEPRTYPLTLLGFAGAGAPAVVLLVAVQTDYQRRTPDRLLGRVAAAFLTVEMAVSVIGAAVGSATGQRAGVMPVINACLLTLVALVTCLPQVLPRPVPVPVPSPTPSPSEQAAR
jgi:predicted MFS family arabinose efflux permease